MPDADARATCHLLLALELDADSHPTRLVLERDDAARLADLIAPDLARLVPGAEKLGLALLGAAYDQAQVLQPGWPLFAALDGHYVQATRARADAPVLFALGGLSGRFSDPALDPHPALSGGTLLLLPLSLHGAPGDVATAAARMEQDFVDKGEASAGTADQVMRALGLGLQHARYLTRHDACALASVQLEHAGFGALWLLLEAALLAPDQTETVHSASGQEFVYADGAVTTRPLGYAVWVRSEAAAYHRTAADRERGFAAYLFELRQYASVLRAHALLLRLRATSAAAGDTAPDAGEGFWIDTVMAGQPVPAAAPRLFAHELRGLGIVALSVASISGTDVTLLAHAYPIEASALAPALAALDARYATGTTPVRLGRLAIDVEQRCLTVPADAFPMPAPEAAR